jgi:hypothetical protein
MSFNPPGRRGCSGRGFSREIAAENCYTLAMARTSFSVFRLFRRSAGVARWLLQLFLLAAWFSPLYAAWLLNPETGGNRVIEPVVTPDGQVVVGYPGLEYPTVFTPHLLSYRMVGGVPQVLWDVIYAEEWGGPQMLRLGEDRVYVLSLFDDYSRYELSAQDLTTGATLWHHTLVVDEGGYFPSFPYWSMSAGPGGVVVLWRAEVTFPDTACFTGRWYSPDGEEVRELDCYPNPHWVQRYALAPLDSHFVLCYDDNLVDMGESQDEYYGVDVGANVWRTVQIADDLFVAEFSYHQFLLLKKLSLRFRSVEWVDTVLTGMEVGDPWDFYLVAGGLLWRWGMDPPSWFQSFTESGTVNDPRECCSVGVDGARFARAADGSHWVLQPHGIASNFAAFQIFPGFVVNRGSTHDIYYENAFLKSVGSEMQLIWDDFVGNIWVTALPEELTDGVSPADPANRGLTLRAYPNPFNGICRLSFPPASVPRRLTISNVLGETVFTGCLAPGVSGWSWDPGPLPAGLYLLRLGSPAQRCATGRLLFLP